VEIVASEMMALDEKHENHQASPASDQVYPHANGGEEEYNETPQE